MKKLMIAVLFAVCILATHVSSGADAFHVAVHGCDDNAGTRDAPFASLHRARDAARDSERSRILVHPGRHELPTTLVLTPADGGLSIEAANKSDKPVVCGGRRISNWEPTDDSLWTARLPDDIQSDIDQLFVNGRRAVRARTPNRHYFYLTDVREDVIERGEGRIPKRATQTLSMRSQDFALLESIPEDEIGEVVIVAYHKWDVTRRAIRSLDSDERTVLIGDIGMKTAVSREWYKRGGNAAQQGEGTGVVRTPEIGKLVLHRLKECVTQSASKSWAVRSIRAGGLPLQRGRRSS